MSVATAGALATAGGRVYAGGSRKANRFMDIDLQVLAGDRRANWRIDVYGPCTGNLRLGRTVGTDAGNTPSDPRLRISARRFTLKWHAHSSLSNLTYSYQLAGHAVAGGYAGTFHYHRAKDPRITVTRMCSIGAPTPGPAAFRRSGLPAVLRRLDGS
jgi:hypothetical protein